MKEKLNEYLAYLLSGERRPDTLRQYKREILFFFEYLGDEEPTKEMVMKYKARLQERCLPSSVNTKLSALNGFFSFIGREDLRVKQLKVQRSVFRPRERELTRGEYEKLVRRAKKEKNERLALIMETICVTGIRVSELPFITVEAVRHGEARVELKGKIRVIFLTDRLIRVLKDYIEANDLNSGPVFVNASGRPIDRSTIWRWMKELGRRAGVNASKIFPHNLRHLFARRFYEKVGDIVMLADVMGHSNINTTRIYTVSSGLEHRKRMEGLGLLI